MLNVDSFEKLFVHELKDMYSAEKQLLEALPLMVEAATDQGLKQAFQHHLAQTEVHVKRLEKVFSELEFEPGGHRCDAMSGLIEEAQGLMTMDMPEEILDAALIAAAQRIEHYEIAGYGVCRTYADKLGRYTLADILQETLVEEAAADVKLSRLAERRINFAAAVA